MRRHYNMGTKVAVKTLCDTIKLDLSNREKPYVCSFCEIRFKTEGGANNHRDNFHCEETRVKIRDAEIDHIIKDTK